MAKKNKKNKAHSKVSSPAEVGVLVDDTDNQPDTIHKFIKKHIVKESGNIGKKETKKEIVAFEDFDDCIDQKTEEHIQSQLNEIYQNTDGSLPDMKFFEKKKRGRFVRALLTLLISLAFLGGVAWGGFVVFQPQFLFSQEDVILSISGEENVRIGQEVHYRIRYRNAQKMPLSKVLMRVKYPAGFVFTESSVTADNDKHDEWTIGSLEEDDSGYIDIFGRLYGNVGGEQSFRVFLDYIPSNFSSEFQKVATLNTITSSSPISIVLNSEDKIQSGSRISFSIELQKDNAETINIDHLALLFDPGTGFLKENSTPESDQYEQFQWTIGKFEKDTMNYTINGVFSGENLKTANLKVSLVGWNDGTNIEDAYVFAHIEKDVAILSTDVAVSLVINGSHGDFTIQPGEVMNTSVVIKNSGSEPLKNAKLRLIFNAPSYNNINMMRWAAVEDEFNGNVVGEQLSPQRRRGIITWDSFNIPALALIKPGDEVLVDVHLPIKNGKEVDLTQYSVHDVAVSAELQYGGDQKEVISSNPIKLIINSDTGFEVRDDVSADDSGGELHMITWLVTNSFHELKNIEVATDLYGDIYFDKNLVTVPAGKLEYTEAEKRLVWKTDTMPTSVNVLALQFPVMLKSKNPSQTQLTSVISFKATDTITGEEIILVGDKIELGG
ncbi:MAG: hypothetical protein COX81_01340 [Candidatus Magasanikbacteria bacterium CG_4_10_14_0_2_um_filter_37_12]|uniref:DUF11 domain-containing protein n=1 Tax=Candidatus Magasanikbacteria bacterium CG_4_10_14_0_2_um_filter_37_12 TaxID=1974637 RepID=A0A2M7V8T8_9BACT|nr:MAG: hypothetical protein COX81_01340 [Candidatus Magasanikbacteria bacterium CG_4_10_14_0_2_um_filter_37_12]